MGWNIIIILLLSIIGMALLLVEIFFIPGITIAGIGGVALLVYEIVYTYNVLGAPVGHFILLGNLLVFILMVYFFAKSKTLNRLSLHTDVEGTVPAVEPHLEGKEGKTISRLAPMGTVEVEGVQIEAKSKEGFVDENTPIVVVKSTPTHVEVVVKKS